MFAQQTPFTGRTIAQFFLSSLEGCRVSPIALSVPSVASLECWELQTDSMYKATALAAPPYILFPRPVEHADSEDPSGDIWFREVRLATQGGCKVWGGEGHGGGTSTGPGSQATGCRSGILMQGFPQGACWPCGQQSHYQG